MNRILLVACLLAHCCVLTPLNAESLIVGGSGADLGVFSQLARQFSQQNPSIKIKVLPSMGSSGGIKALLHNKIDLALTSRKLRSNEITADIRSLHYASTPLVFVVAEASSQTSISRAQVNKIYADELRQWSDGSPLRVILRPTKDSDTKILMDVVADCDTCFRQIYQRKGVPVALTDQESADMVARVPGAIGTSTLTLILGENKPLKALQLDGITPSAETLKNKSYPMYKELYLVFRQGNKNLQKFIEYVYSEPAQMILMDTGHLTIR